MKSSDAVYADLAKIRNSRRFSVKDQEIAKLKEYYTGAGFHFGLAGDTTLRDEPIYEQLDESEKLTANFAFRTVKGLVALETQWPMFDVPPPSGRKPTEDRDKFVRKIKEIVYGTYACSEGIWGFARNGFFKHMFGWSVQGVIPDAEFSRLRTRFYDPEWVYFSSEFGDERKLREIYIVWKEYPDTLAEMFPNYKPSGSALSEETVEVILYYDKQRKMIFADGQLLTGVAHGLGFVPFVIIPNTIAPNGIPGIGDIAPVIGLNVEINKLLALYHEVLAASVRSPLAIYGADSFPQVQNIGKDVALLFSDPNTKAERLSPMGNNLPQLGWLVSEYRDIINEVGGTPDTMFGKTHGSYTSASGTASTMRGLGDALDASFRIQSERMAYINECMLRMYEKMYPNQEIALWGMVGRQPFDRKFKGKDIDGYYRTSAWYPPAIMADASRRTNEIMQKQGAGMMSIYTGMLLDGTVDPDDEIERIENETRDRATLEAEVESIRAQALMNNPPSRVGTQPAPGAANPLMPAPMSPDDVNLMQKQIEAGRINPTKEGLFGGVDVTQQGATAGMPPGMGLEAPMPPTALPEELQALHDERQSLTPVPTPVPGDVYGHAVAIEEIADKIRTIKKISGRIFLVGRLVDFGKTSDPIEIMLTNKQDQGTINNALREEAYYGKLKYKTLSEGDSTPPNDDYLEVTPGTSGYERVDVESSGPPAMGAAAQMPQMPIPPMMAGGV